MLKGGKNNIRENIIFLRMPSITYSIYLSDKIIKS
jgi:hypothetical protein